MMLSRVKPFYNSEAGEAVMSSTASRLIPESRSLLWMASRIGRRQYFKMLESNLPHPLRSPLEFLLFGKLSFADERVVARIETLRCDLARRPDERITVYSGKTEADGATPGTLERSLAQIAYESSVLPRWGIVLYLCASAVGAKIIVELGSSAGISGCYLASSSACQKFITVEGSSELAKLAKANLSRTMTNFEVINASFTVALDRMTPELGRGIDMLYMDGDKQKGSLCRSFERLAPHLNNGSVVVFDDIHWSCDMRKAWQLLRRWQGFSHTIAAGRFGLCFWTGGRTEAKTFDLYEFAGIDLYRLRQKLEWLGRRSRSLRQPGGCRIEN